MPNPNSVQSRQTSKFGVDLPNIEIVAVAAVQISSRKCVTNKGVDIIVATPGRRRLMRRKSADFLKFNQILDAADEMLNMGFQEDIDSIFEK